MANIKLFILALVLMFSCNYDPSPNPFEPVTPLGEWEGDGIYLDVDSVKDSVGYVLGINGEFSSGILLFDSTDFVLIDTTYSGDIFQYKIDHDTMHMIDRKLKIMGLSEGYRLIRK